MTPACRITSRAVSCGDEAILERMLIKFRLLEFQKEFAGRIRFKDPLYVIRILMFVHCAISEGDP